MPVCVSVCPTCNNELPVSTTSHIWLFYIAGSLATCTMHSVKVTLMVQFSPTCNVQLLY